jgi:hypothetical protein
MTAVIRAKHYEQSVKDYKKSKGIDTRRYVKVMGRLTDPKRRQRIADIHLKDTGRKMSDPHQFHFYVGFPIEAYGFEGAFDEAHAYIESQEAIHFKDFEWKITGGEW